MVGETLQACVMFLKDEGAAGAAGLNILLHRDLILE